MLSGQLGIVAITSAIEISDTDVTHKYFVRVDVIEEFPFLCGICRPTTTACNGSGPDNEQRTTMGIPHFTAEASLANARSSTYISRNNTPLDSGDVVVPQYSCNLQYCTCNGYEDCYQMVYVRQVCYDSPRCSYSPYGISCSCQWASV
jgi:hypothetical protein